jgi:hypothetical protein
VSFPWIGKPDGRLYFDGMTFEPQGRDAVTVYLAIEEQDGKTHEASFRYTRCKPN